MIWLILIAALALRLALVLPHEGFLGVDGGAYLLSRNAVLGDEPTGAGFPRPPLAPGWLLVPFTELAGDDVGYKLWSALASLLPILPVYLLARRIRIGGRPVASLPAFAAGFLMLDLLHAEMLVTGALPLIGFSLLGMCWWAMGRLSERWAWRDAIILAGCLGLIPWVNQTTAGLALITIPVYWAALIWYSRGAARLTGTGGGYPRSGESGFDAPRSLPAVDSQPSRAALLSRASRTAIRGVRNPENWVRLPGPASTLGRNALGPVARIAPPLFVGGAIALGALPWYMQVLPVTGLLNYPGPFIYLTHMYDSAWWQFLLAWPLGVAMAWKGEAPWFRALGVLTCLLGTLLVFLSTDETIINVFYRSRYLLAIPFYVGVSWAVWRWAIARVGYRPDVVGSNIKNPAALHQPVTKPSMNQSSLPNPSQAMYPTIPTSAAKTNGHRPRLAIIFLITLTSVLMLAGYISQFQRQTGYSDMATPATVQALAMLRESDPGAGVVTNSFTLSLWVAALNKVPSPHIWTWAPPRAYVAVDKDVRCILGWVDGCEPASAAQRQRVGYVLIDTRFPDYNARAPDIYMAPVNPWAVTAQAPWLEVVFEQGTTIVWRVAPNNAGSAYP